MSRYYAAGFVPEGCALGAAAGRTEKEDLLNRARAR